MKREEREKKERRRRRKKKKKGFKVFVIFPDTLLENNDNLLYFRASII